VPIQSRHADWPVFPYLAGIGTEATLEQAWQQADLGPTPAQIRQGIVYLGAEKADWPNRWQKSEVPSVFRLPKGGFHATSFS